MMGHSTRGALVFAATFLMAGSALADAGNVNATADFMDGCTFPNRFLWSCPANWSGGVVPDNDMVTNYAVFLDGIDRAFLDVPITIETLSASMTGQLRVSSTDLTVNCDILFTDQAFYGANQAAIDPTATLTVGTWSLLYPMSGGNGPAVELRDNMVVNANADFVMDSTNYNGPGNCTPVDLEVFNSAILNIDGDFTMIHAAEIDHLSTEPICVADDFNNFVIKPFASLVNLSNGSVLLAPTCVMPAPTPHPASGDGGSAESGGTQATFEVGGDDLGPVLAGYVDNFEIGFLRVLNHNVVFQDNFDNNQDENLADCTEALYVGDLFLSATSTIVLDNVNIYYLNLEDQGADIIQNGCGQLLPINLAGAPAVGAWHIGCLGLLMLGGGAVILQRRRGEIRSRI